MPDELQQTARAAAASVARAMGTDAWPRLRPTLVELLARYGTDPAAAGWADSFADMIANARGAEQNSLRDAVYARCESTFTSLLAARPDAVGELRRVADAGAQAGGPGSAPASEAPPQVPDFAKAPQTPQTPQTPQAPGGAAAAPGHGANPAFPQAAAPVPGAAYQQAPPPGAAYGQPPAASQAPSFTAPPPPPGPPPGPAGYPAPGAFPQQPGPHAASPYASGPQPPQPAGPYPPAPYPGAPGAAAPANNSAKLVLGGIVAIAVIVGGVFGGIALFGGDDDDSGSASGPGANSPAKTGDADGSGGAVEGPWSGTYSNQTPVKVDGPVSVVLTQDGDKLTGDLQLDAPGCDFTGPVSGKLKGSKITLESGPDTAYRIQMNGTVTGDRMSGSYTTTCNNASGTWKADKG